MPESIKFPIIYECQTEGCPQKGRVWSLRKADVTFRSVTLIGLLDEPRVICEGCSTEPTNITED